MKWHTLRGREAGFGAVWAPGGRKTGFGAVRTPSAPASAEFACVFRCKNNEKTDLAPPFWCPDGQNGESGPQSAAITAPKPVCLPNGMRLLRRNSPDCHQTRRDCAEPRPAAVRPPVSSAPKLIRKYGLLPRSRKSRPGIKPYLAWGFHARGGTKRNLKRKKAAALSSSSLVRCNGASNRIRTDDPRFTRAVLYRLSHAGNSP